MLEDVNTGISWVLNNAPLYGGDPNCVYITGQSAGAQLGALAIFAQVGRAF
jgi:prenylcysteine alpha-carboxyl methylesterase